MDTSKINYSHAMFLLADMVAKVAGRRPRAVACTYEDIKITDDMTKLMKHNPAYLSGGSLPNGAVIFKTMDQDIKVGDFVVVPTDTRHGMTVNKVVAVDCEVNFESEVPVHWIVGTVNPHDYENLRQLEDQIITKLKDGQTKTRQQQIADTFMASLGEDDPLKGITFEGGDAPPVIDAPNNQADA